MEENGQRRSYNFKKIDTLAVIYKETLYRIILIFFYSLKLNYILIIMITKYLQRNHLRTFIKQATNTPLKPITINNDHIIQKHI